MEIWVPFGDGEKNELLSCTPDCFSTWATSYISSAANVSVVVTQSLFLHAKGKGRAWKVWQANPETTYTFLSRLSSEPDVLDEYF